MLPRLTINDHVIERQEFIKFLGVLLDENLNWKKTLNIQKIKQQKIQDSFIRPDHFQKGMPQQLLTTDIYYSYLQTYINYGNIAWGSPCRTNLKQINSQQKYAIRIIFNKNKFAHTTEIFKEHKFLNIYQLDILRNIIFMHRVENKNCTSIFLAKFRKPSHTYPTNCLTHKFLVHTLKLKKSKYRVSIRSPLLWNNILTAGEKAQESLPKFQTTIKEKLLSMTNEINYF